VQRRALLHANPSCVAPCIAVAGLLHRRLVQTLLQWGSVMSSKAVKSAIALVRPSATEPDWSRERCEAFWEPSRRLLSALRDYERGRDEGGVSGLMRTKLAVLRHRFWSVVSGAEIPLNCSTISGGLTLPHPNGVVIHPDAVIGPNCLLFQQVTIGTGPKPGVPRLGGHVDVGAGAKILGGVVIGDHAVIGANAVVINDVPAGCMAAGVPAVIKRRPGSRFEREKQSGVRPRPERHPMRRQGDG
jgi:serine O-acetyltransferase